MILYLFRYFLRAELHVLITLHHRLMLLRDGLVVLLFLLVLDRDLFVDGLVFYQGDTTTRSLCPNGTTDSRDASGHNRRSKLRLIRGNRRRHGRISLFLVLYTNKMDNLVFIRTLLLEAGPVFVFIPFYTVRVLWRSGWCRSFQRGSAIFPRGTS